MPEKNIPDNKTGKPLEYYRAEYSRIDPDEASARCAAPFDGEKREFHITLLGFELIAAYPEFALRCADENCPASLLSPQVQILVMRYLIEGAAEPCAEEYLAYRETPGAQIYDANFQGRCIKRLAYAFDGRADVFEKAAALLGAAPFKGGDAGCELSFMANVRVRLKLWSGDEEFPPSAQILFSGNSAASFSAEDLVVVGEIIITALKELSKKI